jgi:nuclear pore complex protein Nup62
MLHSFGLGGAETIVFFEIHFVLEIDISVRVLYFSVCSILQCVFSTTMSSFHFGGPSPNPSNAEPSNTAPPTLGFSFGGRAATPSSFALTAPATTSFGATEEKPVFAFGGGTAPPVAKKTQENHNVFAFGAAAASSDSSPTSFPAAGSSSFGGGTFGAAASTAPHSDLNAGDLEKKSTGGFSALPSGGEKPLEAARVPLGGAKDASSAAGFAFGASAASAPDTAGGFAFGGAATTSNEGASGLSAAAVPTTTTTGFSFRSPTATPGPPAPVATPGTTPATTPAPGAVNAPDHSTQPAEPVLLEYQTMTVEQILNQFQHALEQDAVVYLEEARRVAEYDAILRDSQHDLNLLTEQVRRSLLEQQQVEQTLTGVGALQLELDRTLETVEGHLDELLSAQSHLVAADADWERERAYQMALDVEARLQELQQSLASAQQQMEVAEERALPAEVASMVRVLHQHQSSLAHLEDVARRMDADLGPIRRVFAAGSGGA